MQRWQYILLHVLNNKFHDELKFSRTSLNGSIFQKYHHQLMYDEYKFEEVEHICKIQNLSYRQLPSKQPIKLKTLYVASIIEYLKIHANTQHIIIYPFIFTETTEIVLSQIVNVIEQNTKGNIKKSDFFY